ncbi:hypothetical protein ABZX12_36995 [Kribbella sp. NPDC003505]|uniref:hypothetical protein n=1 Tax=Kribbella sp. NPDC003505 TaxID=3154448 RepID=UPI0033AB933D
MGEIDWAAISGEFSRRELTLLSSLADSRPELRETVDRALDGKPAGSADFRRAWSAAAGQAGATLVLAGYLYAACQAAWERTGNYTRIKDTIDNARAGWGACTGSGGWEDQATGLFLDHIASLPDCMNAEGAVNSSCPIALKTHATNVAEANASVLPRIRSLDQSGSESFVRFLSEIVEKHVVTYDAIAAVANAVLGWLQERPTAAAEVEACVARLEKAESSDLLVGDVYASELRAHRYALQGLTAHAPGPELTIGEARFVYCYPFATNARIDWKDLARVGALAGAAPQLVEELHLSDIWNGDIYQGQVVTLPPLNVHTTAGDDLRHAVQLRLSSFGNHYIRIEHISDGDEIGLHEIYQGLRRASHMMGDETVTWLDGGGNRSWKRLHEFADDVLEDLAGQAGATTPSQWHADFGKNFNVVVEIRRARTRGADGREREATGQNVVDAAGRLLLNPVTGYATALEEWTRRPMPAEVRNLTGDAGYDTDLIARTDNTTLLMLPGSPSWVYLGQEEKVEFVASLPPLLQRWRHELRETKERLAARLTPGAMEETKRGQVEADRLRLAADLAKFRGRLDQLHSNALCRPAVHRRLVDRLYDAAGLLRYEMELEDEVREVEALYDRVAAHLRVVEEQKVREEEVRTSKYQRSIQVILGVLAALSLVGLIEAINQFVEAPDSGRVPLVWAIAELGSVVLAATAIALTFGMMGRRRDSHGGSG